MCAFVVRIQKHFSIFNLMKCLDPRFVERKSQAARNTGLPYEPLSLMNMLSLSLTHFIIKSSVINIINLFYYYSSSFIYCVFCVVQAKLCSAASRATSAH